MEESGNPRSRSGRFILALRVWHGRIGFAGACFGVLFGATGFLLNHRAAMRIPPGPVQEQQAQIELDAPPATPEVLAAMLAARFGMSAVHAQWRTTPGRPAQMSGVPVKVAESWQVLLPGHSRSIQAAYTPGDRSVEVVEVKAGLVEAFKRLHKAQAGDTGWILLADAFAGMMLFMSLSGLLLWSRLHGSRLLGAGLALGSVLAAAAVAARAW